MIQSKTSFRSLIIISFVVLLTRIPFLFTGLGTEEDAYGIYIVTQGISNSGLYEYSRLPGHPVQELTYAFLGLQNFFFYNLLTALLSAAVIFVFMLGLKKQGFKNYIECGLLLAFIPIIFINSTNAMDYMWALFFILTSFYFLISKNFWVAGAILGIAVGCRITSGAMLFPFLLYVMLDKHVSNRVLCSVKFLAGCLIISFLAYLPVMQSYGSEFFNYYKHFDHPSLIKILFNATVGVLGGIGLIVFIGFSIMFIYRITLYKAFAPKDLITRKSILFCSASCVALYLSAYFFLPFKAEFLIPIIPFIIMAIGIYLSKTEVRIFALLMLIACFIGGVNLVNPLRGVSTSKLSVVKKIERNFIAIDLLKGPLLAETEVRSNQIKFVNEVIDIENNIDKPTAIISGWWYNFILAKSTNSNHLVNYYYYEPQSVLLDLKSGRHQLYYLPEQAYWNDKRFKSAFTKTLATPLLPRYEYFRELN